MRRTIQPRINPVVGITKWNAEPGKYYRETQRGNFEQQKRNTSVVDETRDLRPYVKEIFGSRNGITPGRGDVPNLAENENYTMETLKYITPHDMADKITNRIIGLTHIRPFYIVESSAGIGGNTLSFLDRSEVSGVSAFEVDHKRRKMLKHNIKLYKFDKTRYSINKEFTDAIPIDKVQKGAVLFMDPPWVKPGTDIVLDQGIIFAGKSLQEWIKLHRDYAMIVMKVPPGYTMTFDELTEYNFIRDTYKKFDVIYITPKASANITDEHFDKFNHDMMDRYEMMQSKEWFAKFKDFIGSLLNEVITDKKIVSNMTSSELMPIWIKAFTHDSYSIEDNYELLEFIGDRNLEVSFITYVVKHVKGVTEKIATQLKRAYMSEGEHGFQSKTAKSMHFDQYIRYIGPKLGHKILEDVFESFFGALYQIGNKVQIGLGDTLCNSFLEMIMDKNGGIDIALAREVSKTLVNERFRSLKWGHIAKTDVEQVFNAGVAEIKIYPTRNCILWLQEHKKPVPKVLAEGSGQNIKIAEEQAYKKILVWMDENNYAVDKAASIRQYRDKHIQPFIAKVEAFVRVNGYVEYKIYASKENSVPNSVVVGFYLVDKHGKDELLVSTIASSLQEGERILMERVANEPLN